MVRFNPVNSPESTPETTPVNSSQPDEQIDVLLSEPDASMQEYYKLQQELFMVTLILTAIIFVSVWIFYSLNIALNYLIGACTGVVYLRMLARNVEQLGRERKKLATTRPALLIAVILLASRLESLQIMPIFLGFLTYKAAVIFYMLRTTILPSSN